MQIDQEKLTHPLPKRIVKSEKIQHQSILSRRVSFYVNSDRHKNYSTAILIAYLDTPFHLAAFAAESSSREKATSRVSSSVPR